MRVPRIVRLLGKIIDDHRFDLAGMVAPSRPAYDAVERNPDTIQVILKSARRARRGFKSLRLALHFFVPACVAVGHAAFECQAEFLESSETGQSWPLELIYMKICITNSGRGAQTLAPGQD